MDADEMRFLELDLKVKLWKFKNAGNGAGMILRENHFANGNSALNDAIRETAVRYLKESVISGLGGLYLRSETELMEKELEQLLTSLEVQKRIRESLFERSDMEFFKKTVASLHTKAETVAEKYRSHVGGE